MGEQSGSHKANRQRGNCSPQNGGMGPDRRSPESDPGFINEQMREEENRLNNADEEGDSGFQGWYSSTSEVTNPLSYLMTKRAFRLLPYAGSATSIVAPLLSPLCYCSEPAPESASRPTHFSSSAV
jgi:hypothetical protein